MRAARAEYAKQFGYDLKKMGRDLQKRQEQSGRLVKSVPRAKPLKKRNKAA